ncbi:MAG TPA: AAA family ATPase [Candidatus Tumulicola sp.]|nr:AAA family ATPase [Candidatus Tumulicola sp.]
MRLVELQVKAFGRLAGLNVLFGRGLTVIAGPNESGKTTLVECIVRLLFGYPSARYNDDRKRFAPWKGGPHEATLIYALDDGRMLETWRDFAKSEVPTNTCDHQTKRPLREYSGTRETSPGSSLFKLSLAAFESAAVIRAAEFAEKTDDDARKAHKLLAERIAALVGAAGDSSAAATIEALKQFLTSIGGAPNATKSLLTGARARLQTARAALDEYQAASEVARANIERRSKLQADLVTLSERRAALARAKNVAELAGVRAQLRSVDAAQQDLTRVEAGRASSGAPAPVLLARARDVDDAIAGWRSARESEELAVKAAGEKESEREAARQALDACEAAIKDADSRAAQLTAAVTRLAPRAGSAEIDADTLDRLERQFEDVDRLESEARRKETAYAISRHRPSQGPLAALIVTIISMFGLILGLLMRVPMVAYGAGFGLVAGIALFAVWAVAARRGAGSAELLERASEDARAVADQWAKAHAAECRAVGSDDITAVRAARMAQLERERIRAQLAAAQNQAEQARARAETLNKRFADFSHFDQQAVTARQVREERERALAGMLDAVGVSGATLEDRVQAFRDLRQKGDGAVQVAQDMGGAQVKLVTALAGSTPDALRRREAELQAALDGAAGADGSAPDLAASSLAALSTELQKLEEQSHEADKELEGVNGELRDFERRYPGGGAALEEHVALSQARETYLEAAKSAATTARDGIEAAKVAVHSDFAPVLGAAVGAAATAITGGRYSEAGVDPDDFTVRVRPPEGSSWVEASLLSSGTREQLYLALRAAIAQALGSGERVPLLLDDALAHADETRQRSAIRHLAALAAQGQQIIVLTQREGLVEAARDLSGVTVVTLDGPPA